MSTTTLEKTAVDTGSDLASLVIAYHRATSAHHSWNTIEPELCEFQICRTAAECLKLDESFFGTDV